MGRFIQNGTGVVISVDDSKDGRYTTGWKVYTGGEGDESESLKGLKLPELKTYAAEHGIDLGGATKKDDIVALIKAGDTTDDESDDNGEGDESESGSNDDN